MALEKSDHFLAALNKSDGHNIWKEMQEINHNFEKHPMRTLKYTGGLIFRWGRMPHR